MTELSFLIELLLNHKLPKPTQALIQQRIKEVEANIPVAPQQYPVAASAIVQSNHPKPVANAQCASTMAILAANPDLNIPAQPSPPQPLPVHPDQIAQTPAAAQALAQRNNTIQKAISGVAEPGRTSPRKF